jgi:hypothetical protein
LGGKTSTSTSGVSIPPSVLAQYNSVNQSAGQTAQTPFQTYGKTAAPVAPGYNDTNSGTFVAPTNAEQNQGTSDINAATQPISGSDINSYLSPYLGDVLGSTEALQNQSNQQAQAGQLGNAISSGAFGGDRTGIAAANLQGQENLANSNVIAGIANQGYNTAQGTALTEQQVGLAGGQAEIGAGTVQQQTQQAQDTAEYNQFLQQQSYPFQVDQFLANIAEGTGSLSGSTTTTTQPGGFFSDKRLKRDIKKIGKTYDHQDVVTYKMGDDKRTRIGLIAQDVEKKHPEAVGVAGGFKTVDYGKATEKAANQGHFYAGGVVPIGRKRYADGGSPYGDGLAGVLEAQRSMYSSMAGGAGQRQINSTGSGGGGHSLAVSNAPGVAPQSGISQVNSGINTVNNGYKLYGNLTKPAATPSGGVVPSSATQAAVQPAGLQGAGLQASGVTTAGAPEAAATAAPEAAAGAGAGDAAAAGAADAAATGAAADAAGTAAAGAAGTAAATAGTTAAAEAAAALAAEYAAADVGMAALMVAKRGGRIRRAAGGAGGTPYLEGGLDSSGDLNIPEDPNTSTLKAAPGAGKQPTGLQTMMTMGDPTKWSSLAGGMFSNQALATGGVAGRRGYADSGAVVDSADLPEVDVTANRDPPAYDTAQVPDNAATGVVASDPSGPETAAPDSTGVAAGAHAAPTKSLWDKIKGSALAKPENWIPLANAISAMGTAKTVHPGVALAAGLGAGANSYQGEQTALAQQGRTEAQTGLLGAQATGVDIANQLNRITNQAAADALSGKGPYASQLRTPSSQQTPTAASAAPSDTASAIDQNVRTQYQVPPITPDEADFNNRMTALAAATKNPAWNDIAKQRQAQRVQAQTFTNQQAAQHEAAALQSVMNDPTQDKVIRDAATVRYNAVSQPQWTGAKIEDQGGSLRNSLTGAPTAGAQAQTLTPEQQAGLATTLRGQDLSKLGIERDENGNLWAVNSLTKQRTQIGGAGAPAGAGAAATPTARPNAGGAPPQSASTPAPQGNFLPGINFDALPKTAAQSGFATKTGQIGPQKTEDFRASQLSDANDAATQDAKTRSIITAAQTELGKITPRSVGPASDAYNYFQKLYTGVSGSAPDALVNQEALDKYLNQLGAQNVRSLLQGQKITNQEMMTFMTRGSPNVSMPLRTIQNLVNYMAADNGYDAKLQATKIHALSPAVNADPWSLPGTLDATAGASRAEYVQGKLGFTPAFTPKQRPGQTTAQPTIVRTGTANGRKVNQYSDGSVAYAN